jgi:hypothetical protein
MLKNVGKGKRYSEAPEMPQMVREGRGIMNQWACIRIVALWVRDKGIGQTCCIGTVRAVSAVNANAALALANRPLDWVDDETKNEVEQEARKMNVE